MGLFVTFRVLYFMWQNIFSHLSIYLLAIGIKEKKNHVKTFNLGKKYSRKFDFSLIWKHYGNLCLALKWTIASEKLQLFQKAADCFAPLECASNCKSSGRIISGVMSRFYHKVTVRFRCTRALDLQVWSSGINLLWVELCYSCEKKS